MLFRSKELGALTVAVVTKPFSFEGPQRASIAEGAYQEMARYVDTIITIPNDRVLQIIDKKTSLLQAFKIVDDILHDGVRGISELITVPGLINVDFADVKTIMSETGSALMGIGIGSGETRAADAANAAISSPLLEVSIEGAKGILFTITGGSNLGMQEVSEAAKIITGSADHDVKVIFGAVIDESMGEDVRVTVIATGFEEGDRSILHGVPDDEIASVFSRKKSLYSASTFKKKPVVPIHIEEAEENVVDDEDRNFFSRSVSAQPSSFIKKDSLNNDDSQSGDGEEDLEIPAFIRKKMGM